ncbi:radical SAM protein [Caldimicrobium thiodismutans]|uniref:Radical SAM protein n=1 Tax=Caldimicrobium thiodismutans TaxID=1653476 RepID=A0A0U5AZM5_9BACT|nr:AmmeMemoRadiSam system radical SAM enzyme [Caldimicrobium thiodismutans]BAU23193.1 radical SAM protein [Caldimicrobium thiodismutans]
MKEALLYESLEDKKVRCYLCNHQCLIPNGKTGLCGVRKNEEGILYSLVYGRVIAEHIDPIEKKPLYHFLPGSYSYSIATVGCNFRCSFCQNFEISQFPHLYPGSIPGTPYSPKDIVKKALNHGCKSISYTYTEPTIYFEYALDCSKLAVKEGLKNVFVSNGYMTKSALDLIKDYLHGINVDLKAFTEGFYHRICKAKLKPILDNLKYLKKLGIWVEITTLVIPEENDSSEELRDIARFIRDELGPETPWHISRFYPQFKMQNKPYTSIETLQRAYYIGKEEGLYFVYIGNVPGNETENTFCPKCSTLLIERYGFAIISNQLKEDGLCPKCGFSIAGVWK